MRYEKKIAIPNFRRRKIAREFSLFETETAGISARRALHARLRGKTLSFAEGSELVLDLSQSIPEGISALYFGGLSGLFYAYSNGNKLYSVKENGSCVFHSTLYGLRGVAEALDRNDLRQTYAVSNEGVLQTTVNSLRVIKNECSPACIAYHYERIFYAEGDKISYSTPVNTENLEESVQNAGEILLPEGNGSALALLSYKEKLYLFRERGIMQLRALGDTLNFKVTTVPFACGKIVQNSVACSGRYVYFCTESGVYRFNGAYCTRVKNVPVFNVAEGVSAACFDGKYYLAFSYGEGKRAILCVDEEESPRLIAANATALAGGDALYYAEGGKIYRLTEKGVCVGDSRGFCYESECTGLGLSAGRKRLEFLTVEGEGELHAHVKNERGEGVCMRGRAGEHFRLPKPLCGNAYSVKITSQDESLRLTGITFGIEEEERYGY